MLQGKTLNYPKWITHDAISRAPANDIVEKILASRGFSNVEIKDFFTPKDPRNIPFSKVGIKNDELKKLITRIKTAQKKNETVVIFGDYDADGVCATAIMWEALYYLGINAVPHIPDRFTEGYGIRKESIVELKNKYDPSVIITVDNGIVAIDAALEAKKLGIDLVITDHHQALKDNPKAYVVIHTTKTSGSGISYFVANEIYKNLNGSSGGKFSGGLELAAIGTVADQIPLIGVNRSIVRYGIEELKKTERPGLKAIYQVGRIEAKDIGTYEINFLIAPRINAMGRLKNAIESLRLLCTTSPKRAKELAKLIDKTNSERQLIVEQVVKHAEAQVSDVNFAGVIVLADKDYHEGVIGLAASKLVERYYRPSIVFSMGDEISKASARSISGFSIIDAIRALDKLIDSGGGHTMAAGFSIKTKSLSEFNKRIQEVSVPLLTEDVLQKKLNIDLEISFKAISWELVKKLSDFEPCGIGNPQPTFCTYDIEVLEAKTVGKESKHLKLDLMHKGKYFPAIAFGMGGILPKVLPNKKIGLAYTLDVNEWNGSKSIQLKVKDIMID